MMIDKKGIIIGSTLVLFVVTIAIVLMLIVFALGSGVITKVDSSGGLSVYELGDVGLNNLRAYMDNYKMILGKTAEEGK